MVPIKSRRRQQKGGDDDSDVSSEDEKKKPSSSSQGDQPHKLSSVIVRKARPLTPSRLTQILTVMEKKSYKMKSKEELMQEKIEKLFVLKRQQMLGQRMKALHMSEASKFAVAGDEYCLRKELELGHNINARDRVRGRTVLHEACAAGHFHLVRMLCGAFRAQLDLDVKTLIGQVTALHLAVENNYRQIASLLITMGADVNCVDLHGNSPLHCVKTMPLLKLLLKTDIDVAIRNKKHLTALDYYLQNTPTEEHNKDMIDIMRTQESTRLLEVMRLKIRAEEDFRERELTRAAWINQDESHASRVGRNNKLNVRAIADTASPSKALVVAANTGGSGKVASTANVNNGAAGDSMLEPPMRRVIINKEFMQSKKNKPK